MMQPQTLLGVLGMLVFVVATDDLQLMQHHVKFIEDYVNQARLSPFQTCEGPDCDISVRPSGVLEAGQPEGRHVGSTSEEIKPLTAGALGMSLAAKAGDEHHTNGKVPSSSLLGQRANVRNAADDHVKVYALPGKNYVIWNLTNASHNASFHSNLGGLGPDDGEQALRYFNVVQVLDPEGNMRHLDLVVTTLSEYKAHNVEMNGIVAPGSAFGQINVKSNRTDMNTVTIHFDWVLAGTNTTAVPDKQFFTMYDVDGTRKSHETIIFYNRVHRAFVSNTSELKQSGDLESGLRFSAEGLTNNVPLPMDPENLTQEQKDRAVCVSYLEKGQFKLTFGVTGGRSGRNFAFAGHSILAEPGVERQTDGSHNQTGEEEVAPEPVAPEPRNDRPTRQTAEEEVTPQPTPSLTTCEEAGTCSIYEDPHIRVFDGVQISLMAAGTRQATDYTSSGTLLRMMAEYGSGDMWLVRSSDISIQGRYLPDPYLSEANLFLRAVAVGGPFLKGNTLIVGPLDEEISWNGVQILQDQTSDFAAAAGDAIVRAIRHLDSHLVEDMTQTNAGVDIELPLGVKLTVNRNLKHVNVFIQMPPAGGGQDGMCGNFNCEPADDTLDMILAARNPRVLIGESLFEQ